MQEVVVDLSRNEDAYHTLNVFDETSRVLPSGQRPYAQGISELIPMDTDGDGVDALITTQKVIGAVQAAPIGYVRTLWLIGPVRGRSKMFPSGPSSIRNRLIRQVTASRANQDMKSSLCLLIPLWAISIILISKSSMQNLLGK